VGNQAQFERFCAALGLTGALGEAPGATTVDARGDTPAEARADPPGAAPAGARGDTPGARPADARGDATAETYADLPGYAPATVRVDPRFRDNAARVANRDVLIRAIEAVTTTRPAQHWIDVLTAAKVPCGPVNDLAQAFDLAERLGLDPVVELGDTKTVASPIRLSDTPVSYRLPPPALPNLADVWKLLGREPQVEVVRGERVRLHVHQVDLHVLERHLGQGERWRRVGGERQLERDRRQAGDQLQLADQLGGEELDVAGEREPVAGRLEELGTARGVHLERRVGHRGHGELQHPYRASRTVGVLGRQLDDPVEVQPMHLLRGGEHQR